MTVLGTFGKSRPGGLQLSYGLSGGIYCWDGCKWLDNGCYGQRLELRPDRPQLASKLARHEVIHPVRLTYAALYELQARKHEGHYVPWFRFAVSGALPQPSDWGRDGVRALKLLCETLAAFGLAPGLTHFPVESPVKARWYREQVGQWVTVRQSIQTDGVRAAGPCSFVGGSDDQTPLERLEAAETIAQRRTAATGRPCKVCPHTRWKMLHRGQNNPTTKCGEGGCTACADESLDVVYPLTR